MNLTRASEGPGTRMQLTSLRTRKKQRRKERTGMEGEGKGKEKEKLGKIRLKEQGEQI